MNELKLPVFDMRIQDKEKTHGQKQEEIKQQDKIISWKNKESKLSTPKCLETPKELIQVLISGKSYKGLVLFGEGGVGKTVMTLSSVKSNLKSHEWEYINGYATPLALFEALYYNRDKEVIVLDDVEGLFSNHTAVSILKSALWEADGQRILQYHSTSKNMSVPSGFVLNAKVILLCNRIPNNKDLSVRAMLSRTLNYEYSLSYREKMSACVQFVAKEESLSKDDQLRVIHLLQRNTSESTKDFNFRTLRKAIALIKYDRDKAETLFKATTQTDELKEAYYKVKGLLFVKYQVQEFCRITGASRRTFFTTKKRCKANDEKVQDQV